MDEETKTLVDLVDILKRRTWEVMVPAASLFAVAAIVAVVLPKVYRSTATILIEAQEVPNEYVRANISSYADQRIQSINQQIMGAPRLLEIINRFNLYGDLKSGKTMDEIVLQMRKDIKFTPISAEVVDPRSGRPAQATIAFSVTYQGRRPETVQQVASELSSLYMAENLKVRDKQSAGTSKFLQEEMQTIKAKLTAIEARIAAFKEKNINALPELSQVNMQAYEQADRDVRQLNEQLRALKEKEGYLQSQLSSVPRQLSSNDKESLRQLKLQLNNLETRFSPEYPDVKKTRAEIGKLENQLRASGQDAGEEKPDNPAYITLASQLAGTRTDIRSIEKQIDTVAAKRATYQSRIAYLPRVEEGYKAILVERDALQQKYDDLSKKALEASVAHGLEKEQLGERFTLIDPARLPEKPASPNVPAIMLIGLILGLGSGAGVAALREATDHTVRQADHLARLTGIPVLATIPEITTERDLQRLKRKRLVVGMVAVLAVLSAIAAFHSLIMDLDVLWAKAAQSIHR